MRVIFLDCDGVLANSRSAMNDYELDDPSLVHDPTGMNVPLEKRCLAELQRVAKSTHAVVVLSSTWRLDPAMREFLLSHLEPAIRVVGDTPIGVDTSNHQRKKLPESKWQYSRGAEVSTWLAAHREQVESYVILDDGHAESFAQAGLTNVFIETVMDPRVPREEEGLTAAKADVAVQVLLRQNGAAT